MLIENMKTNMSANGTHGIQGVIPLIINNESVVTDTIFDVYNPATGKVVDRCASASVDDANRAVVAAKAAFPAWSKTKPYDRRDILMRAADIMLSRREELIKYQMEETGAGRLFVEKTFELGAGFVKDFAARIPSIEGSIPSVSQDGECAMVFKEPYGVVLGIAPWYELLIVEEWIGQQGKHLCHD
jgi:acyl-CoA reductase-like NAD-dependent aldehyde dehydrogenase